MKNNTSTSPRSNPFRARYLARFASLASIGAPIAAGNVSTSAHESVSPSPMRSAHVWKGSNKTTQDSANDALPSDFTPSPVASFVPAVNPQDDAEIAPIAYAQALPEIAFHHFAHLANCAPLLLEWKG